MTTKAYPSPAVFELRLRTKTGTSIYSNGTKRGFKKSAIAELKELNRYKAELDKCASKAKSKEVMYCGWIWTIGTLPVAQTRHKFIVSGAHGVDPDPVIEHLKKKYPDNIFYFNLD